MYSRQSYNNACHSNVEIEINVIALHVLIAKGRAQMHCEKAANFQRHYNAISRAYMPLMEEHSDVTKIHGGIIFNFLTGLPHLH